jgi:ADP-heptose:LPS heptosyltransferase
MMTARNADRSGPVSNRFLREGDMTKQNDPFYGHTPYSVLIVRMSALGDILLTLPAVLALKRAYRKTRFIWLVDQPYSELLNELDFIDDVMSFDRPAVSDKLRSLDWFWKAVGLVWDFIWQLRALRLTHAYVFQPLLRAGMFAFLSGARVVVGPWLWAEGAFLVYSHRKSLEPAKHMIERNMAMLAGTRADLRPVKPEFRITEKDREQLRPFFEANHLQTGRYFVLYPGASTIGKQWTLEAYAALSDRLADEYGLTPVLAWGYHEEDQARQILDLAQKNGLLAPMLSKRGLAALFADAALVIGPDTGPIHLANIVNTPVVALFGPTDPDVWRPYWQPSQVVRAPGAPTLNNRSLRSLEEPADSMKTLDLEIVVKACHEMLRAGGMSDQSVSA